MLEVEGQSNGGMRWLAVSIVLAVLLAVSPPGAAGAQPSVEPGAQALTLRESSCQTDGYVVDFVVVGTTYYFGGAFSSVRPNGEAPGSAREVTRHNVAACDLETGAVLAWDPSANGAVHALAFDGSYIYLGGNTFSKVGGRNHRNLARVDAFSGALDRSFAFGVNRAVEDLLYDATTDRLYVGGAFSRVNNKPHERVVRIESVSDSPQRDERFRPDFATGSNAGSEAYVGALHLASDTLYLGGLFSSVNGEPRQSVAAVDVVDGTTTSPFAPQIRTADPTLDTEVFEITEHAGEIILCGAWWNQYDHTSETWLGPSEGDDPLGQWSVGRYDPATGVHVDLGWQALTDGAVQACAVDHASGILYAGGQFNFVNGAPRSQVVGIQLADGALTAWQPALEGARAINVISVVDMDQARVVYGGDFTAVDGVAQRSLAIFETDVSPPDSSPTSPASLSAAAAGSDVRLQWSASSGTSPILGYRVYRDGVEVGANPKVTEPFNVVGDIARCTSSAEIVQHSAVADLLAVYPGRIGLTGDIAYPDGTLEQFEQCYDVAWGQHRARSYPIPGNHEYKTPGADGYYTYWGSQAGDPAKGWYSFDVGSWTVYALNSNRNCAVVACDAGSAQYEWLRQQLEQTTNQCSMLMIHHPRWSSNKHGNHDQVADVYDLAHDYGVDVIVASHDHGYERFGRLDASGAPDLSGPMSFVIGTGGARTYPFSASPENALPASVAKQDTTYGFSHFTFRPDSFSWEFVGAAGPAFADTGSDSCVGPSLDELSFVDPEVPDGTYVYEVEAYTASAVSDRSTVTVDVGSSAPLGLPAGNFTVPTHLDLITGPTVTLGGTATAEAGVSKVFIAIKDLDTGLWRHDDGTWGDSSRTSTLLANPGATMTTWSIEVPLAPGRYRAMVIVKDTDGLVSAVPRPIVRFDVASG